MREFSDFEKKLIRRINSTEGNNLPNLIDPYLEDVSISVELKQKTKIIFQEHTVKSYDIEDRVSQIESIILQSVNLIKLLEEKGYIFTYKRGTVQFPFTYGTAAVNLSRITYEFPDERISELLTNYSIQEIFLTPELNVFVKNNFKTREEKRFNKQFTLACFAIGITFLGVVINFGFNLEKKLNNSGQKIDSLQLERILKVKQSSKIDSVQFNSLMKNIKEKK